MKDVVGIVILIDNHCHGAAGDIEESDLGFWLMSDGNVWTGALMTGITVRRACSVSGVTDFSALLLEMK